MAVAYFMVHWARGFPPYAAGPGANLTILYCFVFLYLFVAGGGEWSLDRLLRRGASSASGTVSRRAA
jgi:putative oxidoreductase